MSNTINTIPIQLFIKQVKSAELSNQREIKIDIKTAKNLVFCLGEITAKLFEDNEKLLANFKNNESINISMDGGGL